MSDQLSIRKHVRFLTRHLNIFPTVYLSLDSCRPTLLFFALSGLDMLYTLDDVLTPEKKKEYIDWLYSLQLTSESGCDPAHCGFRGYLGCALPSDGSVKPEEAPGIEYDCANLSQTYSSLMCLLILGDDLSRVDRKAILNAIRMAQREDGSFWSQGEGSESDMRFVYCAVCVCHVLGDDSVIDWKKLRNFIRASTRYDGGIGQGPDEESHGGSTYCAVAALAIGGHLWDESIFTQRELKKIVQWALAKQQLGFHGRAGKPDDTCYAFWIGASLQILNAYTLCRSDLVRVFLLSAQHSHMGGFAKLPEDGAYPDVLHTYFSIAGLSLQHEPGIRPLYAPLNISMRAYDQWKQLIAEQRRVTSE